MSFREMTDREEITRAALQANRLFSRSVDESLEAIFQALSTILVEELSARLVVVSRLDLEDLSVHIIAAEGVAREYISGVVLSASGESPMGQGPVGQVLRSGEPMVAMLPDALPSQLVGLYDRVRSFDLGGIALAPIYTEEGLWGLLSVYRGTNVSFSPDILPILESFAKDIGDFLDRRRQFQELAFRRSFQEAIESFQSRLLEGIPVQRIHEVLLECIVDRAGFPGALIVDETSSFNAVPSIRVEAVRVCPSHADIQSKKDFSSSGNILFSLAGWELLPRTPEDEPAVFLSVTHPLLSPSLREMMSTLSFGGILLLPFERLTTPSRTTALIVGLKSSHSPPKETIDLLALFAGAARMGLSQRRDRDRLSRYTRFYRAMGEVGKLISRHPAPRDLFDGICDAIVESTGIDLAFISLVGPPGKVRVVSARGRARNFIDGAEFSIDPQDSARCLIHSRTLGTDEVVEFPLLEEWLCSDAVRDLARPWHLRNTLTVSFLKDGVRIGLLGLISGEEGFFDKTLRGLLSGLAQDITFSLEFLERQERLEILSSTDLLTSLPNRAAFIGEISRVIETGGDRSLSLAVGILDFDGFKSWNDAFGHVEGDRLLREMGEEIRSFLPEGMFVGRMGGDEFGFCLSRAGTLDRTEIEDFSRKLLDAAIRLDMGHNLVTGSLGWAIFPEDIATPSELLASADEALYASKASGRNRVTFFGGEIARAMVRRVETRRSFPLALDRGEIIFWLQPQIDVRAGRVEGIEMLVRWRSGSEMVPPGAFIPEVEREPLLIRKLGLHAFQSARNLRSKLSGSWPGLRISLNVGASHFLHPAFLDDVDRAISGETGAGLVVEVTEGASLERPEHTTRIREELRKRGFDLSLDDFGTGFSSLHHVADLSPDEIKLDGSFMRRFRSRKNAFAVVGSTLLLSDLSGSRIVGEGIEDQSDIDLWLRMGGSLVQGYFYARPMPEEELLAFLSRPLPEFFLPPVYPVEELPFLEFAFRDSGEEGGDLVPPGAACPLDAWFDSRGVHYFHLPSWKLARESHREFHKRPAGSTPREEARRLEASLHILRKEMDAYLFSLPHHD
ncbi:MAG: sensor domain-containing phosphodiesterase [Leptospirillia bacterium]